MSKQWAMKKSLGKLYPRRSHPDLKRDRLAVRRMKKGRDEVYDPNVEVYLRVGSRVQILVRGLLMPWKWKLELQSPSGEGKKAVKKWQVGLLLRRGKVRLMVLESNVDRDHQCEKL